MRKDFFVQPITLRIWTYEIYSAKETTLYWLDIISCVYLDQDVMISFFLDTREQTNDNLSE